MKNPIFLTALLASWATISATQPAIGESASRVVDLIALDTTDIYAAQVMSGQSREQLIDQLDPQLSFDTDDQFEARRQLEDYAAEIADSASGLSGATLQAALPIAEIAYDFDAGLYRLCLPSSLLYRSTGALGTTEATVEFAFEGLATPDGERCNVLLRDFGGTNTLAQSNHAELKLGRSMAEELHNSIQAGNSKVGFRCNALSFEPGRHDGTGPRLVCSTNRIRISVADAEPLRYVGRPAGDTGMTGAATTTDAGAGTGAGDDMAADEDAGHDLPPAATPVTEAALGLSYSERVEVQRRLVLLGYNTRGVDGIFGPGTRGSISQWQAAVGLPVSGYLSGAHLEVLEATSQDLYEEWLAQRPATTTIKKPRRKYYRGRDGCLRRRPGNARRTIIWGQSKFCNMRRRGKI